MYKIKIYNNKNEQKTNIRNISCADTFTKRLLGLMGKNKFNGLIIKQKHQSKYYNSIHTSFMKVPIDILYINNQMKIHELTTLNPWQLYIPKKGNIKYIIELPEKSINKHNIKINDKVVITHERQKN